MIDSPRVMVVGLGGIGGLVAGHMLAAGHAVTGVSRNAEIRRALETDGYRLSGATRVTNVPTGPVVSAPEAAASKFDFIMFAVQPPQLMTAVHAARGALKDDGAMVVFQNGLCEERVAAEVGDARVIGGIISWGASMEGPGQYRRTSTGGFTVGRLRAPPDEPCRTVGRLLETVGPVVMTDNLRGARWSKLAFNCAVSTIGTVGGDRLGPLMKYAFIRRLALEVMSEVVVVARAEGVRLEKLSGALDLERIALTPDEAAGRRKGAMLLKHALLVAAGIRYRRLRSSMLAAIERGRAPAVDFLNGEIVTRAAEHGLSVPVNAALQAAVHRLADGEAPGVSQLRTVYEDTRRSILG